MFFRSFLKYIVYVLFFAVALIYFIPKASFFYLLEQKLDSYEIVINEEKLQDSGLYLTIKESTVYVKGIESAKISEAKIKFFGLYNNIILKNIKISSTFSSFIPTKVSIFSITYTILNPLNLKIYAKGDFGSLNANFDFKNLQLYLELDASTLMKKDFKSTLENMKKLDTGGYSFAKTFDF